MNNTINIISENGLLCSGVNRHDICFFENVVFNDSGQIQAISINLLNNKKQCQRCEFLKDEESFSRLLNVMALDGSVNILICGSAPSSIIRFIKRNMNFHYVEYRSNKDFTAFFSKENPHTIHYYYSKINVKPGLVTFTLKMLIILGLYRLIWKIFATNTYIVLERVK